MTHVNFDLDSVNWDNYLPLQEGGGEKYFVGQRYMRGYGVLGSIGRFLLPIAKNIATSIGNEGVDAGSKILSDVKEGRQLTEAIKEHSKKGLENIGEKMKQCGKGKKKKTKKLNMKIKPEITMFPNRPASPTPGLKRPPKKSRKRKPDQLDIF